jgi:hypothetical protein
MHENQAKKMLALMKLSGKIPSALQPKSVEFALANLQQGLNATDDTKQDDNSVNLSTRAYPLIQLLNHAIRKQEYIMWDYDKGII